MTSAARIWAHTLTMEHGPRKRRARFEPPIVQRDASPEPLDRSFARRHNSVPRVHVLIRIVVRVLRVDGRGLVRLRVLPPVRLTTATCERAVSRRCIVRRAGSSLCGGCFACLWGQGHPSSPPTCSGCRPRCGAGPSTGRGPGTSLGAAFCARPRRCYYAAAQAAGKGPCSACGSRACRAGRVPATCELRRQTRLFVPPRAAASGDGRTLRVHRMDRYYNDLGALLTHRAMARGPVRV